MASAVALTTPAPAKTAEDAALTVAEIAQSFSVSVATINRRIAAGELPAVMYRGRKFGVIGH